MKPSNDLLQLSFQPYAISIQFLFFFFFGFRFSFFVFFFFCANRPFNYSSWYRRKARVQGFSWTHSSRVTGSAASCGVLPPRPSEFWFYTVSGSPARMRSVRSPTIGFRLALPCQSSGRCETERISLMSSVCWPRNPTDTHTLTQTHRYKHTCGERGPTHKSCTAVCRGSPFVSCNLMPTFPAPATNFGCSSPHEPIEAPKLPSDPITFWYLQVDYKFVFVPWSSAKS